VEARANRVLENPEYQFVHYRKKDVEKFAEDFCTVYNQAWVKHKGTHEMQKEQVVAIFRRLNPVVDEQLVWFGYHNGEPIAFFLQLPELNQIFKYMNGKFGWWEKLKFVWYKDVMKVCNRVFGVVFGVTPRFQGRGVEAAIMMTYSKVAWQPEYKYKDVEMNWIGDFNPKMMHVCENLGASIIRTHATYRYLFDRDRPFERCPIIE
jgi:hypothetical protein